MPANPFNDQMSVQVGGDASGAITALQGLQGSILSTQGLVAGLGLALAGLAAGGIAKSIGAARDFNSEVRELTKVTNEVAADEIAGQMQEVARTIPLATEQLVNLATQAARFGIEGTENISQFTQGAAKLAFATDLAVEEAGKAMAKLMTLTETPIDQIENLGSAINTLGQNTATSAGEIVDGMLRSSAALSQVGLRQTEIVALQGSLNAVSESASRAGTRLKRLGQEMVDPKKVSDLADALGMTDDEFINMRENDPSGLIMLMVEAMAEGGEAADGLRGSLSTVSQQALAGLAQNLDGTRENLKLANDAFEEGTSINEEFAIEAGSLGSKLQVLRNILNESAVAVGNVFLPFIKAAVDALTRFILVTREAGSVLTPTMKAALLLGTVLGGLTVAVGAAVSALGGLAAITGVLAGAFGILLGPIGLAIIAIAALAAAWQTNLFGIRDVTFQVLDAVQEAFRAAVAFLQPIVENALSRLTEAWRAHGQEITAEVQATIAHLQNVFRDLMTFLRPIIRSGLAALTQFWNQWGDEILTVVRYVFDTVIGVIEFAMDFVATVINMWLNIIQGDWEGAWNVITEFLGRTLRGIISHVREWGPVLYGIFVSVITAIGNWMAATGKALLLAAWGVITDAVTAAVAAVFSMAGAVGTAVTTFFANLADYIGSGRALQDMVNAAHALGSAIREVFLFFFNMGQGIGRAVVAFFSDLSAYISSGQAKADVVNAFTALGEAIVTKVEEFLSMAGKVGLAVAGFIGDWAAYIGSGQALSDIVAAFQSLGEAIVTKVEEFFTWGGGGGKALSEKITTFVGDFVAYVTGPALAALVGAFTTLLDSVFAVFEAFVMGLIGKSLIPDMFADILTATANFASSWLRAFTTVLENILSAVKTKMGQARQGFVNELGTMLSKARSILGNIIDAFSSAFSRVKTIASNIIGAAQDAARRAANALTGARRNRRLSQREAERARDAERSAAATRATRGRTGFQHGGIVTGGGVPAMLHGPEAVIPLNRRGANFLQKALGGAGGGRTFHIRHMEVHADDAEALMDDIIAHTG